MDEEISGKRLALAWRHNPAWLAGFLSGATRELSKTGDLGAHARHLQAVSPYLTVAEIVALYRALQESRRLDSEWRDEFLDMFPSVTQADLPKPIVDEETMQRLEEEAEREFAADIANAWRTNAAWRRNLLFNAREELSKSGMLTAYQRVWLALSARLTTQEIAEIYACLQQSGRPESEWKAQFLELFPSVSASDLQGRTYER